MNIPKAVNIFCGVAGVLVILFGVIVKAGMISAVPASRGLAPIILGAIIVVWSLFMKKRYH